MKTRVVVNLPEEMTRVIEKQCEVAGGRRKGATKQAWIEDAIKHRLAAGPGEISFSMVPNASWHRDLDTALAHGDAATQAAIKAALRCFRGKVKAPGEAPGAQSGERPLKEKTA